MDKNERQNNRFKCEFCEATFSLGANLLIHKHAHEKEDENKTKPYKCEHCGEGFLNKGRLKSHIVIHTGEKPHKCLECGAAFGNRAYLNNHIFTHTELESLKCGLCGILCLGAAELQRHLHTHETPKVPREKSHECEECGAKFATSGHLKGHILTHTGEKRCACDVCGATFARNFDLHRHKCTHCKPTKYHKCSKCPSEFSHRNALRSHVAAKHGGKVQCDKCGSVFLNSSHLKIHTSTKGELSCKKCKVRFVTNCELVMHAGIHYVPSAETQKANPNVNNKKTLVDLALPIEDSQADCMEISYNCDQCGVCFENMDSLENHIDSHSRPNTSNADTSQVPRTGNSLSLRRTRIRHLTKQMLELLPDVNDEHETELQMQSQIRGDMTRIECRPDVLIADDLNKSDLTENVHRKRKRTEPAKPSACGDPDIFGRSKVVMYIQ